MRGETFNCGECWCVVSNQYLEDHRRVCPGPKAVDAKIAAAEKRVLSAVAEAWKQVAPTIGPGSCHAAYNRAAEILLSPKPKKVEVPEVDWKAASEWTGNADVGRFVRFMASHPGAKVVVE